jgi:hypothetical protein
MDITLFLHCGIGEFHSGENVNQWRDLLVKRGNFMGQVLLYKYMQGQQLNYDQLTTMIMSDPVYGEGGGRSLYHARQTITQTHPDGSWTVEITTQPVKLEGVFAHQLPAELAQKPVIFQMNSRGSVLGIQEGPPLIRTAHFPEYSLEEGASWTHSDEIMPVTYVLQRFEQKESELLAHVASTARMNDPSEGLSTDAQSTFTFSITKGYQVRSTTIVDMKWQNGKTLSLVIEYIFKEQ